MTSPLSARQLAEKYPDPSFRKALAMLLHLQTLLSGCIVTEKYRVPQGLHLPIKLSETGEKAFEHLTRRASVPYPEARMLCLLDMWNVDLLIDPLETDARAIADALSREIKDRKIRYPYSHGRLLYDKAASELEPSSTRFSLSPKETQLFLEGTPQGVFQAGFFVTGPYGLLRSREQRFLEPHRRVPYHCSDATCDVLHAFHLSTASEAPILEGRSKLQKFLDKESKEPSDWALFMQSGDPKITEAVFSDLNADSLILTIGDCFQMPELRSILNWLITKTDDLSATHSEIPEVTASGIYGMDEAQLLQLISVASSKSIIAAIDTLTLSGTIEVPDDEVRRAVVNSHTTGPYGLRAELNKYGIRFTSDYMNMGPLRLRRLISHMYPLDNQHERTELDWQMRDEVADTTEERIEQYVHRRSPRDAVSTILLVRHSNLIVASERLRIQDDLLHDDDDRINSVLWKLGFSISDGLDRYSDFWRYLAATKKACQRATVNPQLINAEKIRREAGPFFPELEKVLKDCLAFTTWALLTDHHAAEKRYVYQEEEAMDDALRRLHEINPRDEQGRRLSYNGEVKLYALIRGFGALGDHLDSIRSLNEEFLREDSLIPRWANSQELQKFPFIHTAPFLDLLPESQNGIIDTLRTATSKMTAVEVNDVRNTLAHPRTADVVKLSVALDAIEEVMTAFRSSGFMRQKFQPTSKEVDESGNSVTTLTDPFGHSVRVFRPSYFDWLDLPAPVAGVHFMPSAYFYEPSRMLRFTSESSSSFSDRWSNYPRRPRERGARTSMVHPNSLSVPGHRRPT